MDWPFWRRGKRVPKCTPELWILASTLASDLRRDFVGGDNPPASLAVPIQVVLMDGTVVSKRVGQPLCVADIAVLTASVLGICLAESGITLGLDGISKVTDGVVNVVHHLAGAPMNVEAMADGTANILIRTYGYTFKAGDVVSIASLYTEVLKSWQRRVR